MLALARVLAASPKLLIADEMSLGLAPLIVDLVFESLDARGDEGVTVLLIEQFVERALGFADQAVVLRHGLVGWQGAAADAGDELLAEYLGGETASTIWSARRPLERHVDASSSGRRCSVSATSASTRSSASVSGGGASERGARWRFRTTLISAAYTVICEAR